jgi:transcriptional antiterminator RfaH
MCVATDDANGVAVENADTRWFLLRTKQHREALVRNTLSKSVASVFYPFLKTTRPLRGERVNALTPLFPCYLFARFDWKSQYHKVQRTPGVVGVVCAGDAPCEVEERIILEIKRRGIDGVLDLPRPYLRAGQLVNIVEGPLRGISGIVERYLSGPERVALLVNLISGTHVRVVLSSTSVGG